MTEEEFELPDEVKIRVFKEHADEALALLRGGGFEPESTLQSDDAMTFVFKTITEERMWKIAGTVPPAYYAVRGIVGESAFWNPDA